jgi:hypothetical protein
MSKTPKNKVVKSSARSNASTVGKAGASATVSCPSTCPPTCPPQPRGKRRPARGVAFISVNSHAIKRNVVRLQRQETVLEPVYAVRTGKGGSPTYPTGDLALLDATGNVVGWLRYDPQGGLPCGARAYLELLHPPVPVAPAAENKR